MHADASCLLSFDRDKACGCENFHDHGARFLATRSEPAAAAGVTVRHTDWATGPAYADRRAVGGDLGRLRPPLMPHLLLLLARLYDSEDDESHNGDPEQEPERDTVKPLVGQ